MVDFKLTVAERCILRNQFEILATLKPAEAEHFRQCQRVVEEGWEHEYEHFVATNLTDAVSLERCREVREVLDMYTMIQRAIGEWDAASAEIKKRALFPGFPSAEVDEQVYVEWMRKQGEYELLEVGVYNALPQLERYRAMLRVYRSWNNPGTLSPAQAHLLLDTYNA